MWFYFFERELMFLEAAMVVLAVGAQSENHLVEALEGVAPQVHAIGDCVQPRDTFEAIHDANDLVRQDWPLQKVTFPCGFVLSCPFFELSRYTVAQLDSLI